MCSSSTWLFQFDTFYSLSSSHTPLSLPLPLSLSLSLPLSLSHTHTHHTLTHTHSPQVPSSLFFQYNDQLGPPYHILVDTNFINFSIQNKLDIMQSCMDCLYAKCVPCITDCVMAELEKLGSKFRVAQRIVKDSRFERLPCTHKGTYADDCLVNRVTQVSCTCTALPHQSICNRRP